jgi:hypothetical protein
LGCTTGPAVGAPGLPAATSVLLPVSFDTSFSTVIQAGAGALLVGGGGFFNNQRRRLVAMAARHAIFAIYNLREFVEVGGLMSYGGSTAHAYRRAAIYVGGSNPCSYPDKPLVSYRINRQWLCALEDAAR